MNNEIEYELALHSKVIWGSLTISSVIVGLIGNSVLLHRLAHYEDFTADNSSVFLVRTLAIIDILIIATKWIITIFSMLTTWTLGMYLCILAGNMAYTIGSSEFWILSLMSLHQLYYLSNPPCNKLKLQHAKIATITTIVLNVVYHVIVGAIYKTSQYYTRFRTCEPEYLHIEKVSFFMIATVMLLGVLPGTIMVMSNVGIIVKTYFLIRQHRVNVAKTSIRIFFISISFLLTATPLVIRIVFIKPDTNLSDDLLLFCCQSMVLHIITKPIIYLITNRKFRTFLQIRWKKQNKNQISTTVIIPTVKSSQTCDSAARTRERV